MYNILFKTHITYSVKMQITFNINDYKNEKQILMQIDIGIRLEDIIQ